METFLLYIEPVALNNNPDYHKYWIEFIVENFKNTNNIKFILASSLYVCQKYGAAFSETYPLNSSLIMANYDYDTLGYTRSVCDLSPEHDAHIEQYLMDLKRQHNPNYVLSWTENKFLKKIFRDKCLFIEIGPLPRYLFKASCYIDPFGQHKQSALTIYEEMQAPFSVTPEVYTRFQKKWIEHLDAWSEHIGLRPWIRTIKDGRKLTLLALQPRNDFGYLGCNFDLDEITLIRKITARDPENELVIPIWHPVGPHPSDALVEELTLENPNLRIPPVECRFGKSEMALNDIDEIVTVSSNVAFAGALMGKRTTVLGESKFSLMAKNIIPGIPRMDILAFAMNGYAITAESWRQSPDAFLAHLRNLQETPYLLFNQKQTADEHLFDDYFS